MDAVPLCRRHTCLYPLRHEASRCPFLKNTMQEHPAGKHNLA